MLIRRCAWHPQFHGYPFVHGIASWRGGSVTFTDGVCRRCAARVRSEWELGKVWEDRPRFWTSWWPRLGPRGLTFAAAGACAVVVLVLSARALSERPMVRDRSGVRKVPVATVARISVEPAAAPGTVVPAAQGPALSPVPPAAASASARHPGAVKAPGSRAGLSVRRAARAVMARIPRRPARTPAESASDIAPRSPLSTPAAVASPPSTAAPVPAVTVVAAPPPSPSLVPAAVSRSSAAAADLSRSAVRQAAVRLLLRADRPAPSHAGSTVQAP